MQTPCDIGYEHGLSGYPNCNPYFVTAPAFAEYNEGYEEGVDDRRCLLSTPESLRAEEEARRNSEVK